MNHYSTLGIKKTASSEEIKDAYKKLVKKYHPDVYPGDKSIAERKIKEINEAYEILSNPASKKEYDELINPTPSYTSSTTSYSYTPPKYDFQSSAYSYENYKKRYSNTYNNYGQSNYDYQKRYTNYHRSKTPNSNYQSAQDPSQNDFTDRLTNVFDSLSKTGKIGTLSFIFILLIIFICINTYQLKSLMNRTKPNTEIPSSSTTDYTNPYIKDEEEPKEEITVPSTSNDNVENTTSSDNSSDSFYNQGLPSNPYLDKTTPSENNSGSTSNQYISIDEFDLNDYISDSDLRDIYAEYDGTGAFESFEEFKESVRQAFYYTYVFGYSY